MTIKLSEYIRDAGCLWAGEMAERLPLVLIDLDQTREWPDNLVLPPCPVVGFGNADHPLAGLLDTVVENPVSLQGMACRVLAHPQASALVAQLLRILPDMDVQAALMVESIAYGLLQGGAEHEAWLMARQPALVAKSGQVIVERHGHEMHVILARSAAGNAIDVAMRDGLREAFAAAQMDATIENIKLSGAGRSFCLGADLAEFGTTRDGVVAHHIRQMSLAAPMISRCASRLAVHIQGACVGSGLEMAAWAKQITADQRAWFQLPELAMGLLPGAGGCVSVSRRIGRQRTALMVLSGRRISANTALEWGLIDAISSDESGAN